MYNKYITIKICFHTKIFLKHDIKFNMPFDELSILPVISLSFDFKIAVFDLDDTLWNGKKLFNDVKYILTTLKTYGIKLYIASYNLNAPDCCKYLSIYHYFDGILYGRNSNKLDMINMIREDNADIEENNIIFFDDNIDNIDIVKNNSNIMTCLVDSNGLRWNNIKYNVLSKFTDNKYCFPSHSYNDTKCTINTKNTINNLDIENFHISDRARYAKASFNIKYFDE